MVTKNTSDVIDSTSAVPAKRNGSKTAMTKAVLVRLIAEKMAMSAKQSLAFFDLLAETAIQETKRNGEFTIPGVGKLVKAQRKARIGRNPQTGESIKIKAKTTVKFRLSKAAKDVIAPTK